MSRANARSRPNIHLQERLSKMVSVSLELDILAPRNLNS